MFIRFTRKKFRFSPRAMPNGRSIWKCRILSYTYSLITMNKIKFSSNTYTLQIYIQTHTRARVRTQKHAHKHTSSCIIKHIFFRHFIDSIHRGKTQNNNNKVSSSNAQYVNSYTSNSTSLWTILWWRHPCRAYLSCRRRYPARWRNDSWMARVT